MDTFSIWHWLVVLIVLACLALYVVLLVRARRLLMIADPAARFWNPNLVWLGLLPYWNCLWLPLTVYAVERTSAKDPKFQSIGQDWVLRWSGRFLKFGLVGLLLLFLVERVVIFYVYPWVIGDGTSRAALESVLGAVEVATWTGILGFTVSMVAYPLRLKRHLPTTTKRFAEV